MAQKDLQRRWEWFMNFMDKISGQEYNFLRENKHLGDRIGMLCVSGSYGYGTNIDGSDLDLRGFALPTERDIILGNDFGQVEDRATDTVIYSFDKIVHLLSECNPNVIELLGLPPANYLICNKIGMMLNAHSSMFLSKLAVNTFGGYANQQLRRIQNKSAKKITQEDFENYIFQTIRHSEFNYKEKYGIDLVNKIKVYIDKSKKENLDVELFLDFDIEHMPLRDVTSFVSDMNNIIKMYNKTGGRNNNAILHDKLGKHMMHLVRLYYTCFDILEKGKIITYRPEREELLKIRNGLYLDGDTPKPEFTEFVNKLEARLTYAKENTDLPDKPDMNKINDFKYSVYKQIINDID